MGIEDPFSALSHLFGAAISLVSYLRSKSSNGSFGATLFSAACILLLFVSGVFHLLPDGSAARGLFQRMDHVAIFILIGSTFTPVYLLDPGTRWRWLPLTVIWSLVLAGVVFKVFYFSLVPRAVGVWVYLGLGWLGSLVVISLARKRGVHYVRWLLLGGVAYTMGGVCELAGGPTLISGYFGSHELFHVIVLVGIYCHWQFIWGVQDSAYLATSQLPFSSVPSVMLSSPLEEGTLEE